MAKSLSTAANNILRAISADLLAEEIHVASPLLAEATAEDLDAFGTETLAAATRITANALSAHKKGKTIVQVVSTDEEATEQATIISIVNENMPFLFDSVLGEINEQVQDVRFLVHPVLDLQHAGKSFEIIDKTRPGLAREKTLRTSVILAIVDKMPAAETKQLEKALKATLAQTKAAVADWQPMNAKMDQIVTALKEGISPARKSDIDEAIDFLSWLRDDHFTFLGIREYNYVGGEKRGQLERADAPALGILQDPNIHVMRRNGEPITTTPEIRAFLTSRDVLIVTKANVKSVVHRRTYMDYIGVKKYDSKGKLAGEIRIVGLFTSGAYTRSVQGVPFIRSKAEAAIERSDYELDSHSGKALLNILESYPRDELFQIDVPTLSRNAEAILSLSDRPRIRVLSRIDAFERFVSVLIYVPRERYSSQAREKICEALAQAYEGRVSAYYPSFPEGSLARVHLIVGRDGGQTPKPTQASLERIVSSITRTWEDNIAEQKNINAAMFARLSFSEAYRESVAADQTVRDIDYIAALDATKPINVDFHSSHDSDEHKAALRIYHLGEPVALSARVPLLENMGFRVISELTYQIDDAGDKSAQSIWIHEMQLESADGKAIAMDDDGALFEKGFLSIWSGDNQDDAYNGLMLSARFEPRQANVMRAYGRFLKQAGISFGQKYLAGVLVKHQELALRIFELFDTRMNPDRLADPEEDVAVTEKHVRAAIADGLNNVPNIDEDQVLRRFINLIDSTLRTNYYQRDEDGISNPSLAFKFDPSLVDGIPAPRPYREIYVFAPDVEGLHLRFGPIARGGLRWSDRSEDYRTEVLGLVKAQQVKNAVIVPVGSKGAFYPMRLPKNGSRDEIFEAGRSAYITFISALLSVTDNIEGADIIAPARTVRHDRDDPYLVVAADKGTATFSDTANGISQDHDFWLDDAFASGGSAGYDHKKMGITARGGWEAVKRHFREMDKDIQEEPFTVVGIGDMSGDVFGNGMLLSKQIKLVAAFDHRDMFIDPDPDPASSFQERERLFNMGRCTWQDYNEKKLSKGGGIFPRSQKIISLSQEAANAIGLDKLKASPNEILNAILKADVELMWFGGIGTYIRASHENDADVGDKANDAIRITAKEVRAKVLGEGANLGVTQPARIEYGLLGGRCNSDAIDNSAGVNSSDVEVNIKIALATSLRDGSLSLAKRNTLLEAMTESVADLVLENNYEQTLTISRVIDAGVDHMGVQARLMEALEDRGKLHRAVEDLPNNEVLAERRASGVGLTRSETGVLLSYAKIVLLDDLVASDLPDDPYLEADLMGYFPPKMQKAYGDNIRSHRLRREIIATVLANETVNKGGPSVISRFEDATGALPSAIVRTHVVTRDAYDFPSINAAIDKLDNKISGAAQLALYKELATAQRMAIGTFIKNDQKGETLREEVEIIAGARDEVEAQLANMVPAYLQNWIKERQADFKSSGLSDAIAKRLAILPILTLLPDIIAIARSSKRDILHTTQTFFGVTETFKIGRLEHLANALSVEDYYDELAQQRALDTIYNARKALTTVAVKADGKDAAKAVEKWASANQARIARVQDRIEELTSGSDLTVSRLSVAAGLLADLAGHA